MLKQRGCGFGLSIGGIAHDLFEYGEVIQIALPAGCSDAADGLRAVAIVSADDLDHFGSFENTEVPAQVAIGKRAELFEVIECQAFGIGDERGEHTETRSLMNNAVEAFVSEAAFSTGGFSFH